MNDQVSDEIKVEQMVRLLRWSLVVVVVIAVAGLAYNVVQRRHSAHAEKAFTALFQAEKLEESAIVGGEDSQSILPSLDVMMKWDDARKADYVSKLETVVREYPDSVAASLAGLRLGRWNFANKNYDKAIETYRAVVDHGKKDKDHPLYVAMAYEGLGVTLETQGKLDEAYKTYSDASNVMDNPLKPLAYLGMARVLEQQGKRADAKARYEKLINEFPNTEYERRARALMAISALPASKG
jgi:TolA-binding protein